MAANNPDTLFKMLTHDIQNVNIVHWMRHGFRGGEALRFLPGNTRHEQLLHEFVIVDRFMDQVGEVLHPR